MSRLPGAGAAIVDPRKITHYLLVPDHPDNGGKAKFFTARGFGLENVEDFRRALLEHPVENDLLRVIEHEFGTKYLVQCSIKTPDGRNPCVITIWNEDGGDSPRFVTAYPAA